MLCELCSAPERTNACVLCPPDIFPHAKTVPTWHLPTVIWYRSPLLADLTEPCLLHIFWWISKCSTCTRAKAKVQKHLQVLFQTKEEGSQASQSIHMSIISAWEGLCGSSQQALCVHALHGQATISIRPRKRAGSHCISLTSGGK